MLQSRFLDPILTLILIAINSKLPKSMGDLQDPTDGGTDSIYFWPMFQAYVREYPHKIWPKIWY